MKGLAGVDTAEGNFAAALEQERAALAVLDASVVPTHPRIAHHLAALSSLEIISGNSEKSAALDKRLNTILEKPLGPWKEDFLETAEFYAKLLRKNGKSESAARLEQLRARHKDLR